MIERIKTRARDFEQCGEIASVLIKEKRLGRFSPPDFIKQIRAVRNLQRARSAKFPAQDFFASPITQRAVNVALCVLIRNRSRLSHLLI